MSFLLVWLSSMIMDNGANFLRNDILKANVFGISKQSNNGKKIYVCIYIHMRQVSTRNNVFVDLCLVV